MSTELQSLYPEAFIGCSSTNNTSLCTPETCCLAQSYFLYVPDYASNLFFAIFFGVFVIPQVYFGVKYKTWGYMAGMVLGLVVEVLGYVGRLMLNGNPYSNGAFLL
jgi:hypothetical protein